MYYIIRWHNDTFLVYDVNAGLLAEGATRTVLNAIRSFNAAAWNISSQPGRFVFTEDILLEYNIDTGELKYKHPIVYKLPSIELSYLQQHYPELLI